MKVALITISLVAVAVSQAGTAKAASSVPEPYAHRSFDNHESVAGQLEIENRVPAKVLDDLRARGHVPRVNYIFGW